MSVCMYVCVFLCVCVSVFIVFFRLFQALVVDVDKQKFVRRVSTMSHTCSLCILYCMYSCTVKIVIQNYKIVQNLSQPHKFGLEQ